MTTSTAGIELIHEFESFRSRPYLDVKGVPTIGWGFTWYPGGRKVTMADKPLTRAVADVIFRTVLVTFEKGVENAVKAALNQNQFDALVSFSYNVGVQAFSRSTLLRLVNANPSDPAIEAQFKRWTLSGGKHFKGLARRRDRESQLYFKK